MDSENPNSFAGGNRDSIPLYDANKPLPPSWFSSAEAIHAIGSIPSMNQYFSSSYGPSWWRDQMWSDAPPQYDNLEDLWRVSNYPMASSGAAMASFERLSGGENQGSNQTPVENLQLQSSIIPKANLEVVPPSVASESMVPPERGHEAKNDSPSTMMQHCNVELGNGGEAQKVTSVQNSSAVHQNGSSQAANPTELNQNLEKGSNKSGTNPEPQKAKEDEEMRKARKREANREYCRRTRLKKKKQYLDLELSVINLRNGNMDLKKRLLHDSKEYKKLTKENDSILKELVDKYGEEAVADLSIQSLPEPQSTAAHHQTQT